MYPSLGETSATKLTSNHTTKPKQSKSTVKSKRGSSSSSSSSSRRPGKSDGPTSPSTGAESDWLAIFLARRAEVEAKAAKTSKAKAKASKLVLLSEKDAAKYAALLRAQGVSTQDAMTLSDARLKQMGVSKSHHRTAILDCAREIVVKQMQQRKHERTTSGANTARGGGGDDGGVGDGVGSEEDAAGVTAASVTSSGDELELESIWNSLLLENDFTKADAKRYVNT
jgi:hypothetical protein